MVLLRFLVLGSHSGVQHRLQLRDAVAVLAAGQYHLLAAIGQADLFKILLCLGQLALLSLSTLVNATTKGI